MNQGKETNEKKTQKMLEKNSEDGRKKLSKWHKNAIGKNSQMGEKLRKSRKKLRKQEKKTQKIAK